MSGGTVERTIKEADPLEQLAINTIRTLSMDGVQAANSGHPGTPMALAPVAYCLWQRFLRFDPDDCIWPNRDRFVLSAGHASMLLYSMLHLTSVKGVNPKYERQQTLSVTLDDIKRFRQLDSRCPGHPEYRWTSGIETTTGPLGQGVATSVGMAMAARWQANYFNRPNFTMFDYNVYAICGDGCLMEGISSEAASLAGHLQLSNLCWIYDNNHITIEGNTALAFSEDVATRFIGMGWNVTRVGDANDLDMLSRAINVFQKTKDRPTLIIVDSHIAYGAPTKQDTSAAHGEPLGDAEIRATKVNYKWPKPDEKFYVPDGVREHFTNGMGKRGKELNAAWLKLFGEYKKAHPQLADHLEKMQKRELPAGWDKDIPKYPADKKGKATRDVNGDVLNAVAQNVPWLVGGSADLAPSTKTRLKFKDAGDFSATETGRNLHFGIREHAMGAIMNGMALSKIRAFGSGFLIFSDYGRAPIRLAAIMEIPVIYCFTHDSIGVGEDGPTHQPIEQLASLRAIPGLITIRPGDANECAEAWKVIMKMSHEPVALILSRQAMPTLDRTKYASAENVAKGAYVLADPPGGAKPEVILMATGSEVGLAIGAHEQLIAEGIKSRVVSMPSWELFEHYSEHNPGYHEQVLPPSVKARVSIEQASTFGWAEYVGFEGKYVGMTTFGASAPLDKLQEKFGFTVPAVVRAAKEALGRPVGADDGKVTLEEASRPRELQTK